MTATASRTATGKPPADVRRFDRRVAAVLMPIGPAAVAVLRFVLPAEPATHPGAQRLVVWLGLVAVLTLLPGALAAIRLLRRYTPRLATWTAALLVPGYLGMTALIVSDAAILAAIDLGMPSRQVTELSDAIFALPTMSILVLVFVVGHILGTLLLGIAAFRARLMPRPVAVALAGSQFVHLAAFLGGWPLLDLLAWTTTAVGMAFLARVVLRTSDDEWDLPPLPR
ncbi:hypothetical protein [Blastococcus sp. CT_GayMR16]|uniref:hypothetical protein n=1 Tax=Blastococcus sp. CT_GayMR16 TaxID=2559607 RepID=UPI0010732D41|nr:hypothetical protein [Blastococcus sp. CT_GayMR16]TFV87415.1 hypothetical protein E4P38_14045 [Blastococcus sp. CT_GayMR16]